MLLNQSQLSSVGWLTLTPLRLTIASFLRDRGPNHSHSVKNRAKDQEMTPGLASRPLPAHQQSWTCSQATSAETGCMCSQPLAKEVIQLSLTCNEVDLREVEMFFLCQVLEHDPVL